VDPARLRRTPEPVTARPEVVNGSHSSQLSARRPNRLVKKLVSMIGEGIDGAI
jgi:hypothetical protein